MNFNKLSLRLRCVLLIECSPDPPSICTHTDCSPSETCRSSVPSKVRRFCDEKYNCISGYDLSCNFFGSCFQAISAVCDGGFHRLTHLFLPIRRFRLLIEHFHVLLLFFFFFLKRFGCCSLIFVHFWPLMSVTCEHATPLEGANNRSCTVKVDPQSRKKDKRKTIEGWRWGCR